MPADTQAVAMLQYSPSTSVVLLPFFCCYCCNGMHGMYLASYLVGHRGAHWFAVTVRVNSVFSEKNVVCIVNVGFTPLSFPFFSCGRAQTAMCDHFVCSCVSPEVVRVFPWISFKWAQFYHRGALGLWQCSLCLSEITSLCYKCLQPRRRTNLKENTSGIYKSPTLTFFCNYK